LQTKAEDKKKWYEQIEERRKFREEKEAKSRARSKELTLTLINR